MTTEEMMFFNSKPQSLELYEELSGKILERFPGTEVQVHKSQIDEELMSWLKQAYEFALAK